MDWLNLHTSTLDSETYRDAAREQQAVWLTLLRYCAGQENGGCIAAAKGWNDDKWRRVVGVTLAEVSASSGLFLFTDEGDLEVEFYPHDKESLVKRNRKSGRSGGNASARARAVARAQAPASAPAADSASTEGKGREGKGIGREGEAPPPEDVSMAAKGCDLPSDAEVREFCAGYQDFAIGCTTGIPETWWLGALALLLTFRTPPHDWRRWLMLKFRDDFTNAASPGHAKANGLGSGSGDQKKNGGPAGGGRPVSAAQALYLCDQALEAVAARLNEAHALNQPADLADRELERELQKKRAALTAGESG